MAELVAEFAADFAKGRFVSRIAATAEDLCRAQTLRQLAFLGADSRVSAADEFDPLCTHFLIEDRASGQLVCCFRLLPLSDGQQIERCYSAQFYGLNALHAFDGPMLEIGRFCMHPKVGDPDILRLAWGALTAYVDAHKVEMLFGCSSFSGTDAALYSDAFAMLRDRHLAPERWLPRVKAPDVFCFASRLRGAPDLKRAQRHMPPLLRSYLLMGGWVSDHAVVDHQMNTLHVFTGLEIRAIPPARKRLLRALAA